MTYDFRDKVILVTGGAGGIGSALCHRFAAGGARLVVVDIDEARAGRTAGELPGSGHVGLGCDLLHRAGAEQMLDGVAATRGRIDALVNNVGMTSSERFDARSVESIERDRRSTPYPSVTGVRQRRMFGAMVAEVLRLVPGDRAGAGLSDMAILASGRRTGHRASRPGHPLGRHPGRPRPPNRPRALTPDRRCACP